MSSLPKKTGRKDDPTTHQRVCTSDQAINRRQKASEAQQSPKRINLPKEIQQPTNLKRKITHQEPVVFQTSTTRKYYNLGDNEQFLKDIEIHKSKDQAHTKFSELYREPREPWLQGEQLKQVHKTHMNQIKDQDIQGHRTRTYLGNITMTDKAASLTTLKSSLKKVTITRVILLKSICLFLSSFNIVKLWN